MWHLAILLLTLPQANTAQPTKPAAMAVATLCDEAAYIEQLRNGLAQQLTTSKKRLLDLQNEAEEMELAAATATNKKTKRAYYILEALARARAARQSQAINVAEEVMTSSLQTLAKREAQLQLLYTIYPTTEQKRGTASKTSDNPSMYGSTTYNCAVTTTPDSAEYATCKAQTTAKPALKGAYTELSQESHIKATPDAMFKRRSVKITAHVKGTIGNAMATGDKGHCQDKSEALTSSTDGLGATIEFAAAADATLTDVQLNQGGGGAKRCPDDDPDKDKGTVSQAGLAYAICKVRDLKIALQETVKTTTKTKLQTDPDAPTILAALSRGPEEPSSKPLTTDEIKQLLTDTFGRSDNVISESFIEPLATKALKLRLNGVDSGTTLSDYVNKAIIGAALTASRKSEVEEDQSCRNRETEQSVAAASTAKCKEDTEENKCKEDKNCEYSDGKCKLKEGVKVENDAKTTNTTGSNSFVIRKVPLLIAVLLLA
uniref:Variant surface glycoprotein 569 n=1 Tax=Trypanosoma brucei TaxID=5691 RepID=M4T205_9TRYP|nr:variant surface glycoprotein 569 [Trypanosoma brucei]